MIKKILSGLIVGFLLLSPVVSFAALSDGLVSYWKMDDTSGNAVDSFGTNNLTNNGTLTYSSTHAIINNGAVTSVTGPKYLSIANNSSFNITDDFSLSMWIYPTALSATDPDGLVYRDKYDDGNRTFWLRIGQAPAGKINFLVFKSGGNSSLDSTTIPLINTMYYVVATYHYVSDGSSVSKIYINGSQDATDSTQVGPILNSSASFAVGGRKDVATGEQFEGTIDELVYWNKALTSTEVTTLWNSGAGCQYGTSCFPAPSVGGGLFSFGYFTMFGDW